MARNRILGRQYELARISVPQDVADFIESKRDAMRHGESRKVYEQMREERDLPKNYAESERLTYLTELFWVLQGDVPILLRRVGMAECVPTNYLERDVSTWGFQRVQPCVVLSLRVKVEGSQKESVRQMESIVERKMRLFQTDFYFHDMMLFSRDLCRKPILWAVGTGHTFNEVLESEEWAAHLLAHLDSEDVLRFIYQDDDQSWMGAALRVACGEEDEFYYHDGAVLHKVSRERFQAIHDRYVEKVRGMVLEAIKGKKAA